MEVLDYPVTEFHYWAIVFLEEYYQEHPEERRKARNNSVFTAEECESEQAKFKMLMTRPTPRKTKIIESP
ncbi:MAG: hypothetical protein II847_00155 [Ruminobacter sp.]|uniref:hypothetical protein n=1 Tax=Ruminobacter sp. TaxID=2774296 RepID=UPI00257B0712|nr:hypothetical protein [Ruminobacter sp.]MBQ3774528.1 hypothetical protein [Ruminobacter sp.]